MAMAAFIESAVTRTARQSENAPKASDAATASINRGEATLSLGPEKPGALEERFMAEIPGGCGRITRAFGRSIATRLALLRRFRDPAAAGVNGR